ncbi:hypothetical protein BHM03_00059295 [Ensete ventricosum]|nr:hypothetical protein BHM03_00059295 [Ensete ventricosum]
MGGVGRVVLMEITLGLLHVLPELPVLQLRVMGCGAEQVGGGSGRHRLIDLVGLVAEGRVGCVSQHFGTGEEMRWIRVMLVALRAAFSPGRMIRIHKKVLRIKDRLGFREICLPASDGTNDNKGKEPQPRTEI